MWIYYKNMYNIIKAKADDKNMMNEYYNTMGDYYTYKGWAL